MNQPDLCFEFGNAEKQTLDKYSIFLRFRGPNFNENLTRIKSFWNRIYHGAPNYEWEVPYSCYEEIKELYKDMNVQYINNPPKASFVSEDDILNGLDFNGFNLYDYQLDGVKFGLNHRNFLLLDEQRVRKNITSINLS